MNSHDGAKFGDRVRTRCTATGRYVVDGWALVVSASSNDLFLDRVDPGGQPPHPKLPAPSDDALSGAHAALTGRTAREVPPWLAALVRNAALMAEEIACNEDHDDNDGCDGCAWDQLYAAVPQAVKAAAERAAIRAEG